MLFENRDGKLENIKQIEFKLEKDLQRLVENNMYELFRLKFLVSEYSLNNFRFDSVAYDDENNAFIIVEYKRGANESLVDQGYAYLNTVLDRKADLVLLFNNLMNMNKKINDFDWSATRIYFISPKFTDYQKVATGYQKMPFQLFEVNRFNNGIILVNEVNNNKIKDNPVINETRTKEIKVYTEEDFENNLSDNLKEVYEELKNRVLSLGNVELKMTKLYAAFKVNNTNICDVEPFKKSLKVFINLSSGTLDDPNNIAKDVSNIGHHGNGDYCVDLLAIDDIDYLIILIRQAYRKCI